MGMKEKRETETGGRKRRDERGFLHLL